MFVVGSILFLPKNVMADVPYITYTEVKVEDQIINSASYSYDGSDGDYVEYYMNDENNNVYSFILTGYNLNDSDEYTYTLTSDFKKLVKTYTGEELKKGVLISGDDGNSCMESKVIDNNNVLIKNKYNDIYFKKTTFRFNNNFDSTKMDEYFNQIAKDGKMKVSLIDPRGDGAFAETAISSFLQKVCSVS